MNNPSCHPDRKYFSTGMCKSCWNKTYYLQNKAKIQARQKARRLANPRSTETRRFEMIPEQRTINSRNYYHRLRDQVLVGYGDKCSHCGFSDRRALQIDHVNGGGNKMRNAGMKDAILFRFIIKNNFPPDFQLLCANCNFIKRHENDEFERTYGIRIAA